MSEELKKLYRLMLGHEWWEVSQRNHFDRVIVRFKMPYMPAITAITVELSPWQ